MVSRQNAGQQFVGKIREISDTVRRSLPGGDDRGMRGVQDSEPLPRYENFYVKRRMEHGYSNYSLYKKGLVGGKLVGNLEVDKATLSTMSPGYEHMTGPLINYSVERASDSVRGLPKTDFPAYLMMNSDIDAYEGPQPPEYDPKKERQKKVQGKIVKKFSKNNRIRS